VPCTTRMAPVFAPYAIDLSTLSFCEVTGWPARGNRLLRIRAWPDGAHAQLGEIVLRLQDLRPCRGNLTS
ncbi:MAG: hypothetical protein QNJ62_12940, partial [Methyloceanibacter sp.]|nr:hypothetical protein [Methyloceanibacter sp.]